MFNLKDRNLQPEWMDGQGIDPHDHAEALRGLKRINSLSRAASSLFVPIRALARGLPNQTLRVLDLACGGGDNTLALAELTRREGLNIHFDGCDLSDQAVAVATRSAAARGLNATFFTADALNDPLPGGYDVLLCSLFLHHLESDDASRLLRRMAEAARHLVLVNDLIRSPLGYLLAWSACRLLSRSTIVHHDGPISVQGAFRTQEVTALAARAGLEGTLVRRCWPERYLLQWTRRDALGAL
jgi:2-polyprenyl-3-methyl-5-hydroxy-6-metoxy-1,4-benzoquinol methylase